MDGRVNGDSHDSPVGVHSLTCLMKPDLQRLKRHWRPHRYVSAKRAYTDANPPPPPTTGARSSSKHSLLPSVTAYESCLTPLSDQVLLLVLPVLLFLEGVWGGG